MGDFLSWLYPNWFALAQTIGIMGSLWLAVATLRLENRGRRLSNLLALATEHRELWSEVHRRADLARIMHTEVDLVGTPLSVAEEEFLNLVFVHFETGWHLAREGRLLRLDAFACDVCAFLALPIPRAVWERTKSVREKRFVHFVEKALGQDQR